MSMILIVDSAHDPALGSKAARRQATLPIRCKLFGPGREDWNRGIREVRWTILREGRLSRTADGRVRLHGLLGVDLCLDAGQLDRICREGLRIASSDLEIDIGAGDFAKALAGLPASGTVLPFVRRAQV